MRGGRSFLRYVFFPKDIQLWLSGQHSCWLWMERDDCKVSLNPNLLELNELSLMLNSLPAEVSGSPPKLAPLAFPAVTQPPEFTRVNTAMRKSIHERSHQSFHVWSSSRKTPMRVSSLMDVPVGSMALEEDLLGKGKCISGSNITCLASGFSQQPSLSWNKLGLLSPHSQGSLVWWAAQRYISETSWVKKQRASSYRHWASTTSEGNVCLSILQVTLATIKHLKYRSQLLYPAPRATVWRNWYRLLCPWPSGGSSPRNKPLSSLCPLFLVQRINHLLARQKNRAGEMRQAFWWGREKMGRNFQMPRTLFLKPLQVTSL